MQTDTGTVAEAEREDRQNYDACPPSPAITSGYKLIYKQRLLLRKGLSYILIRIKSEGGLSWQEKEELEK